MILSSRNLLLSVLSLGFVTGVVVACGSDESTFGDETFPPGFVTDGSFSEGGNSQEDLYKNDPPPAWCGPDSGAPLVQPGGTADCPDDKNKPGCGCGTAGETAKCWTGLRKHRNLGICADGVTTCKPVNETSSAWGPCEGQVLPKPDGKGGEACSCFSFGEWNITNTSPCLREQGGVYWAHSTVGDTGSGCDVGSPLPAGTSPAGIWSTNTLKVDCAGLYKLCFKIRAGDYNNPQGGDCTLGEVCVDADYKETNAVQKLPDLSTWHGTDGVCAKKWEKDTPEDQSPGYGEMIVKGKTVRCDSVDDGAGQDFVFHRVQYCPRICRPGYVNYNPDHPACKACQLAGTGQFD